MRFAGKVVRLTTAQPFPLRSDRCLYRNIQFRTLSRKKPDDSKSWSEIADEAIDVAKSVVEKIVETGQKVVKAATTESKPQRSRKDESLTRPTDVLGGFLGRTIGGMLGSALKTLADEMVESQRESRDIYETASIRVQSNDQLRQILGPVSCGMPYSQSTQTQSINGVTTKQTSLAFPVDGPRGSAQVQVTSTEDRNKVQSMEINVRLPNGKVIRVDGASPDGRTIDVDWKDI
eukprot:g5971.t1